MEPLRYDRYVTIIEYFALGGESLTQSECDAISDDFKTWHGGRIPCTAVIKNGRIQVSITHFSHDSGFGLGSELFTHLFHNALSKFHQSVAYDFVETRENL